MTTSMEVTSHYLPTEWEERWKREKERRRRVIEEGGEGIEQDNRELKRIIAYNDSRMGLNSGRTASGGSDVRMSGTSQEVIEGHMGDETSGDEERNVYTCRSKTFVREVFAALREFQDASLLTDLTLTTEDGNTIQVHSLILAAVSTFILERLREKSRAQSSNNREVGGHKWSLHLGSEVDQAGLQAIIQFAYSGNVSLSKNSMTQIKAAAEVLEVPRLVNLCNMENQVKQENGAKTGHQIISVQEQMRITLQSVQQLWADKIGCDVILEVDGTYFHVHRVILAISSDYFRGMFTCGMRESHQSCIALLSLSAAELEALTCFSYTGTLPLSWDSVFEITCTALQLQFQLALVLCLSFMQEQLQASSCLDVASFAEAYGMSELLEEANDFVLRNFWEVSATTKFQDLPADKLLYFLSCDGLCVHSELAVFRAVISWIEANPEERVAQAGLLMTGVRFPLMTFREFREVRAINLRMECLADKEMELYGSALKEFGFSLPESQDRWRVRQPKDVMALIGGDQLNQDGGQRIPSREIWFSNSLRSGIGLIKNIEWRRLGDIPDKPKFRHGVAVIGGKLYVVGGCYYYAKDSIMKSVYSYDPGRDSWKRLADMQESRSNFSAVVHEECLYAIGGDKEINNNTDSVEMYNQVTDTWSFVQPLNHPLSGYAVSTMNGGIFISGGFNCKYVCLVSMFLYHPGRGTIYLADMAHDRALHCMKALRGGLYVAGGVCNLRNFYTDQVSCEVYNPVVDSWTSFASLPVPHVGAASAVLEEKMYMLGGYSQEDYSESRLVHRFDPGTQRWENMGKLPGAVADIQACVLRLPQHFRH